MKAILRSLRFLVAVCISALLLFSSVLPTFSANAAPMKNEPNANANAAAKKYEQVSREPLEAGHPGPNLKESQEKTKGGGINEVQGTAAAENMKRPSNSGGVPTVEKDIKNALEKAQDVVK